MLRHRLVEIQQDVRDDRPRRALRGCGAVRDRPHDIGRSARARLVVRALSLEESHQSIDFCRKRVAREHQLETERRPRTRRLPGPWLASYSRGQRTGGLERRGIVEQRQRLQRRIRPNATGGTGTRGWWRRTS